MIVKYAPSFPVSIFMAGNIRRAKKYCRSYCDKYGFCVTVTPTTYVYTGGQETGFIVGLINYPRFPATEKHIKDHGILLGYSLLKHLGQDSFSLQTPIETIWYSRRPEDN